MPGSETSTLACCSPWSPVACQASSPGALPRAAYRRMSFALFLSVPWGSPRSSFWSDISLYWRAGGARYNCRRARIRALAPDAVTSFPAIACRAAGMVARAGSSGRRRVGDQSFRRIPPAGPRRRDHARGCVGAAGQSPGRPDGAVYRAQRRPARPSGTDKLSRRPHRARGRRRSRCGAARSRGRDRLAARSRAAARPPGRLRDGHRVSGDARS